MHISFVNFGTYCDDDCCLIIETINKKVLRMMHELVLNRMFVHMCVVCLHALTSSSQLVRYIK